MNLNTSLECPEHGHTISRENLDFDITLNTASTFDTVICWRLSSVEAPYFLYKCVPVVGDFVASCLSVGCRGQGSIAEQALPLLPISQPLCASGTVVSSPHHAWWVFNLLDASQLQELLHPQGFRSHTKWTQGIRGSFQRDLRNNIIVLRPRRFLWEMRRGAYADKRGGDLTVAPKWSTRGNAEHHSC